MKRIRFRQPCFVSLPDSSRNYAPGDCDTFDDEIAARVIASGRAVFVEGVEASPPKPIDPDGPMIRLRVKPLDPTKTIGGGQPSRKLGDQIVLGGEVSDEMCEREGVSILIGDPGLELVEGYSLTAQGMRFAQALQDPAYGMKAGGKRPTYSDFA